jgi:hypothetical protein
VVEASNAGQRSVEQEDDLMRACSSKDSAIRATLADTASFRLDPLELMSDQAQTLRGSFDAKRCGTVISTLARNHTWLTPTLVTYQPGTHGYDSASTHAELSRYAPGLLQAGWHTRASAFKPDTMAPRSFFSFERTGELQRAGVKLLAGTDAPQAFIYPGFSLHDELELLVRSGLTPLEALRTATYNPAEYLGALDSLGTVAKGKLADLVLLDANPLDDIRNTRRISAVIANGRLYDSTARAALLDNVATALKR